MWSMSNSALGGTVVTLASLTLITACASTMPAPRRQPVASAQVDQQHLAELDQLIADVTKNLGATRMSATQAETFAQARQQQLADFRAKLGLPAPATPKATPGAEASPEPPQNEAVQRALFAFEARAAHADALLQLRKAQVAAREARLAKLQLERRLAALPVAAAGPSAHERQLEAAKQRVTRADQDVAELTGAEHEAEARSHEALNDYRSARAADPSSPESDPEAPNVSDQSAGSS
jgi:DNA repair exonuclease SbcCD ATPase subunit